MKKRPLQSLAQKILVDALGASKFHHASGVFYRELPSGIIHLIAIALDSRTNDTFQVMCGLNSPLLGHAKDLAVDRLGFIGCRHLTPTGWDINSGHWPCRDDTEATKSLLTIRDLLISVVEPWFQSKKTLTALADEMQTEEQGLLKAKLYDADGDQATARATLLSYRERLNKPRPWDDRDELRREQILVDEFLRSLPGGAEPS